MSLKISKALRLNKALPLLLKFVAFALVATERFILIVNYGSSLLSTFNTSNASSVNGAKSTNDCAITRI